MIKIVTEKLKPSSPKKENTVLVITVIFLILIAALLIKMGKTNIQEQKINTGEVSSYSNFSSIESGIYADLINFTNEIKIKTDGENLPSIKDLEKNDIPPFTKDITWEERGKIQWEKIEKEKSTYYIGLSENVTVSGNFAVIVNNGNYEDIKILFIRTHLHKEDVEFSLDENFPNWEEIIPYTGEDERRKFEGKGDM